AAVMTLAAAARHAHIAVAAHRAAEVAATAIAAAHAEPLTAAATLVTRTEPVRPRPGLTDGELGNGTRRWLLAFGTRQRRANQPTMRRAVVGSIADVVVLVLQQFVTVGVRVGVCCRGRDGGRAVRLVLRLILVIFVTFGVADLGLLVSVRLFVRYPFRCARGDLGIQRGGAIRLLPLSRHLGVLVLVVAIARRAPRLLHVVADHRHDGVVGQTPLARTVVIQNVTKPKLALLHQRSRRDRW